MNQSCTFRSEQCTNIHQQYTFVEKLGEGYQQYISFLYRSFGHIWRVQNNQTGMTLACKLVKSELKKEKSLLLREIKILSTLKGKEGLTQIRAYGQDSQYTFFMMDLYGINLETLRVRLQNYGVPLLLEFAIQVLDRIQTLHQAGVVHRDIKPENFVLARHDEKTVVLIDFGLSKIYYNNNKHLPYKENKGMIGTARYASLNALRGNEQSRRDDVEAIAYMMIYLGQGQLPWMNIREEDKLVKYAKILKMKETVTPEMLAFNLPKVFSEMLRYAQKLEFEECPDYEGLRSMLRNHLNPSVERSSIVFKRSTYTAPQTQRDQNQNRLGVSGQYTQRNSGVSQSSRKEMDCSSGFVDWKVINENPELDILVLGKAIKFRKPGSSSENLQAELEDEGCSLQMHKYHELKVPALQQ